VFRKPLDVARSFGMLTSETYARRLIEASIGVALRCQGVRTRTKVGQLGGSVAMQGCWDAESGMDALAMQVRGEIERLGIVTRGLGAGQGLIAE
jgi:hypothetical protein